MVVHVDSSRVFHQPWATLTLATISDFWLKEIYNKI
jgi:hypothetical protein